MIEDVELILATPCETVINTDLTLKLLRCYSKLYLGGEQPRWCARSQREYYRKLKLNGLEMATLYENAKDRTFKINYKGILHISSPKIGVLTLNCELIGDEMAIDFLNKGIFQEENFTVLPKNYNFVPIEKKTIEIQPLKKGRKAKNK